MEIPWNGSDYRAPTYCQSCSSVLSIEQQQQQQQQQRRRWRRQYISLHFPYNKKRKKLLKTAGTISIHFQTFLCISVHFHTFPHMVSHISIHFHTFHTSPNISIDFHRFSYISIDFLYIFIHFHTFP